MNQTPARRRRLTYANLASTLALVVALGSGGAYAADAALKVTKNSVGSKQIKNGSIKGKDVQAGTITADLLAAGVVPTSLPGKIVLHRTDVTLVGGTPGPVTSAFATCPVGQKIIGGSVNVGTPENASVLISRPSVDNVGTGTVPDDGGSFAFWKGTARATTAVDQVMRVFAICSTP
jgi:hypothetical protein